MTAFPHVFCCSIDERPNSPNNKYFKEKHNSKKGERDLLWQKEKIALHQVITKIID